MITSLTGAIIAGGKSRRMGRDKRLIPVEGQPMILRVLQGLAAATTQQLIIASDAPQLRPILPPALPILADAVPDAGALGGILTALLHSRTPWVCCVAADMPFISPALIERLAEQVEAGVQVILPMIDQRPQSLHALYHTSAAPVIRQQIATGNLRIADAFKSLAVRRIWLADVQGWGLPVSSFVNINTPDDLEKYAR